MNCCYNCKNIDKMIKVNNDVVCPVSNKISVFDINGKHEINSTACEHHSLDWED